MIIVQSILLFIYGISGWMRLGSQSPPQFEDYAVKETFVGKLAPIILPKEIKPHDAEEIMEAYGYQKGPNFAGRFIIVDWACGSPCKTMTVVDAKSGNVYYPPITYWEGLNAHSYFLPFLTYPGQVSQNPKLEYRVNSKLLKVKCNDGRKERPYTFYFLWENSRWTLLLKVPI